MSDFKKSPNQERKPTSVGSKTPQQQQQAKDAQSKDQPARDSGKQNQQK